MADSLLKKIRYFIDFQPRHLEALRMLRQVLGPHLEGLASDFFAKLGAMPETAGLRSDPGRQKRARQAMLVWLRDLLAANSLDGVFPTQEWVGQRHAEIGVSQQLLTPAMGFIRAELHNLIHQHIEDPAVRNSAHEAVNRRLDVELTVILDSYRQADLDRITRAESLVRRHLQEQVQEAQSFSQALLDNAAVGVLAYTSDGVIRAYNRQMERITGHAAGQVRDLSDWMQKMFPSARDRREAERCLWGATDRDSRQSELLADIVRGDGQVRSVQFYVSPIVLADNRAAGAVAIAMDVSHQQTVEQQLIRSERLAAIGELATSLAHEIKNPLAGISGAIQIIGSDLAPQDPRKEVIEEILHQVDRLDNTVKDLLGFARPNPLTLRPTKLSEVIDRTLTILGREPAMRRVKVIKELPDDLPSIEADADQLEQVFLNVVQNGVQAVGSTGTLTITAAVNGPDRMLICVRDDGPGMTAEQQRRAFEPFYTTKARGTGLGLPICKKIVEAHGGRISLDSDAGRGTEVRIVLPVQGSRAAAAATEAVA